jgi:hypothetical protein
VEPWLVAWLVVGLSTTGALVVVVAALVRHVIVLGRTAARFQEEVAPITDEMAAASARTADAVAALSGRASRRRPVRRRTRR